jgi:hypothetical protein
MTFGTLNQEIWNNESKEILKELTFQIESVRYESSGYLSWD